MASPKTIAMNVAIPKPTPIPYLEGRPNFRKIRERVDHRISKGNTAGKRRVERKLVEIPKVVPIKYLPVKESFFKELLKRIKARCKLMLEKFIPKRSDRDALEGQNVSL